MADWEDKTKLEEQTLAFFARGLKVIWGLLGTERKTIIQVVAGIAVLQVLALSFNVLLKFLFDELPSIINGMASRNFVIFLLAGLVIVKAAQILFGRFAVEIRFLRSIIKMENTWPVLAHKKLLELSFSFHEKENTGKKIEKINKGIDRMWDIVARLRWGFIPQLFYLGINFVVMMILDWRLGLLFSAPFPFAAYIYLKAFRSAAPVYEQWEAKKEESSGLFTQSIINIQTVQNYVQEKKESWAFSGIRQYMQGIDIKASVRMQYYFLAAVSWLWIFFIGTILVGFHFVVNGSTSIGTLVYIISTGSVTLENLWHLVHEYTEILKRLISVFRMKELLDEEPEIKDAPGAVIPRKYRGLIELENIKFVYPGKERLILDNFSLKIEPGEMVAFVGKSGEGKTTTVRLITRMFDVDQGAVKLDGTNIKKIEKDWYRRLFAIVQQDVDVFDATIFDNIRYASPQARRQEVEEAVRAAYLHRALSDKDRFPKGMDEMVGERGVRLSGGERQRVGIARAYLALLKGAKVLVLDEATSNLDSQAELAIQKMIAKLRAKQSVTIIAIAHRLSTIRRADAIYVINNGRIAEQGDHNSLVNKNGIYASLASLQMMGELRK